MTLLLLFQVALGAADVHTVDCGPVLGRWTGTGDQPGYGSWSIDWRLDACGPPGARVGTVRYDTLGCRGELYWVGFEAGSYVVEEHVRGRSCAQAGTIRLTPRADGTLDWAWYWPVTNALGATSVLALAP